MDTDVIIKANSHGIRIIFHNDDPLEQLLVDIKEKLQHQNAFLKKEGKISVSFEGRELSREEIAQILFALNHLPETEVEFICDIPDKGRTEDLCNQIDIPPHRSKHRQPAAVGHTAHVDHVIRHEAPATDTAASNKKVSQDDTAGQNVSSSGDNNLFFYGNIRSGQTLEVKKSIIIIGNVEKRAKVISGGNIIILGSLHGSAVAGKDLQKKRFVLALTMEPVHIKIGTVSYAAKRQFHDKLNTKDAVIAYCENDQLIFQPLSQASL